MKIEKTDIEGLIILHPKVFRDERGFFMESFRQEWVELMGLKQPFIQDNHARSENKHILRGLHFQAPPHAQSKLIWVSRGAIFDVAVDLRTKSKTYGQWRGFILDAENFKRLLVPRGFAHGYLTLEPGTEVQYKVDAYYNMEAEGGLPWDDPMLDIKWPVSNPQISDKDKQFSSLKSFVSPF